MDFSLTINSWTLAWQHLYWSEVEAFPVSQFHQALQEPSSPLSFDSCWETCWMQQQCSVYNMSNCSNRSSSTNLLLWGRWGREKCSRWSGLLIGLFVAAELIGLVAAAAEGSFDLQISSWLVAEERRRLLLPLLAVRTRILEWGSYSSCPHNKISVNFQERKWQRYKALYSSLAVLYLGSWF